MSSLPAPKSQGKARRLAGSLRAPRLELCVTRPHFPDKVVAKQPLSLSDLGRKHRMWGWELTRRETH